MFNDRLNWINYMYSIYFDILKLNASQFYMRPLKLELVVKVEVLYLISTAGITKCEYRNQNKFKRSLFYN